MKENQATDLDVPLISETLCKFGFVAADWLTLINTLLLSRVPGMPVTLPCFTGATPAYPLNSISGIMCYRKTSPSSAPTPRMRVRSLEQILHS